MNLRWSTVLFTLLMSLVTAMAQQYACGVSPCRRGCFDSDSNGLCESTPTGYYSPPNDDAMYPCAPGTFAELPRSTECTPCNIGSYTEWSGSSTCFFCPPGQYSDEPGASNCKGCQSYFYYGPGANDVFVDGQDIYCLKPLTDQTQTPSTSGAPSQMPTTTPSHNPSPSPSTIPSRGPSNVPSNGPSHRPFSAFPSSQPSRLIVPLDDDTQPTKADTPLKPTIGGNKPTAAGNDDHDARNEAFWQYLPLVGVALIIVLFALIVQRYRPKKSKRPPRPVPLPPPPLDAITDVQSGDVVLTTKASTETDSVLTEDSLKDVYIEDELASGESLSKETQSV